MSEPQSTTAAAPSASSSASDSALTTTTATAVPTAAAAPAADTNNNSSDGNATTSNNNSSDGNATTSNTTSSEKPTTPSAANRNDNSNPQQGTSSALAAGANTRGGATTTTTTSNSSGPRPAAAAPAASNGHASPPRANLKIPPFQRDARKLFVGGLPADITDEEFRTFFEQFGEVMDSIVMIDYDTGRSRGFGFITFCDANVARFLLAQGHDLNTDGASTSGRMEMRGKWIEMKPAEPKGGGGGGRKNHHGGGGRNKNNNNGGSNKQGLQHASGYQHHHPSYPQQSPAYYRPPPQQFVNGSQAAVMVDGIPTSSVMYPDYGSATAAWNSNNNAHGPPLVAGQAAYYAPPPGAYNMAGPPVYFPPTAVPMYAPLPPPEGDGGVRSTIAPTTGTVNPTELSYVPPPPPPVVAGGVDPSQQQQVPPTGYAFVPMMPPVAAPYGMPLGTMAVPPHPMGSVMQPAAPGVPNVSQAGAGGTPTSNYTNNAAPDDNSTPASSEAAGAE